MAPRDVTSFTASTSPPSASLATLRSSWFPHPPRSSSSNDSPNAEIQDLDTLGMSTRQKKPLLSLQLSSTSFLNANVASIANRASDNEPLYTIKTSGTSTSIMRATGSAPEPSTSSWGTPKTTIAEFRWPHRPVAKSKSKDGLDGVLLRIGQERWRPGDTLLKSGALVSSRKSFSLPGYGGSFKWKRTATSYHCTVAAVKGPIATLDCAVASLPARLRVFETMHDKYDAELAVHEGVSVLLLDYLLVTSLLLVTDVHEWMAIGREESHREGASSSKTHLFGPSAPAANDMTSSARQWRKIVYGESLFTGGSSKSLGRKTSADSLESLPEAPPLATASQWAKIVYGDPIYKSGENGARPMYPSLRTPSPEPLTEDSRPSTPWDPANPSSESINILPKGRVVPPSHGYMDPMFYDDEDAPPVPKIPSRYRNSIAPSQDYLHSAGEPAMQKYGPHVVLPTPLPRVPDSPMRMTSPDSVLSSSPSHYADSYAHSSRYTDHTNMSEFGGYAESTRGGGYRGGGGEMTNRSVFPDPPLSPSMRKPASQDFILPERSYSHGPRSRGATTSGSLHSHRPIQTIPQSPDDDSGSRGGYVYPQFAHLMLPRPEQPWVDHRSRSTPPVDNPLSQQWPARRPSTGLIDRVPSSGDPSRSMHGSDRASTMSRTESVGSTRSRRLPTVPQTPGIPVPPAPSLVKRSSQCARSLPLPPTPTPGAVPPTPGGAGPSSHIDHGKVDEALLATTGYPTARSEKEAEELRVWANQHPPPTAGAVSQDVGATEFEVPPPAYNSIQFH